MFIVRGFSQSAADWVAASGTGEVYTVAPPTLVRCSSPFAGSGTKLSRLNSYVSPAAHVSRLPNARCIGTDGAIVTMDGLLLLSTVQRFAVPIAANRAWDHLEPSGQEYVFDGTLGVMTHHGSQNFCHVLADGLPRIWLVRKSGIEPDAWVVPARPAGWFSELLDLVDIPEKRRVYVEAGSTVTARNLIVPERSGFALAVAPWARTALLDLFGLCDSTGSTEDRVWISREMADRRRWIQERDAWLSLEDRGFEICTFEERTIEWQYRRIANCNVIAGPHGAGLAWGLAAQSLSGLLFEVANTNVVHNDYQAVAAVAGWRYARSSHADVPMSVGDDYLLDLDIEPTEVISQPDIALRRWQKEP